MKPVFSSFDHAYVLNLDEDHERMRRISHRLRVLSVSFERFPAIRQRDMEVQFQDARIQPAAYATAESHLALLRTIWERQHDHTLILEDDAVFRDDSPELMAIIAPQLASERWDVFYMGLHLIRSRGRITRNLARVGQAFHAHALAVTKAAVPLLINSIEQMLKKPVRTFDGYDDDRLVKLYSIPILAIQEPNYSYTYGKSMDRLPQYFGVFDGDEFESHCVEMQQWKSEWREILAVDRALSQAENLYLHGPLEEAVRGYAALTTAIPQSKRRQRLESMLSDLVRALESGCPTDKQLIDLCSRVSTTLRGSWQM